MVTIIAVWFDDLFWGQICVLWLQWCGVRGNGNLEGGQGLWNGSWRWHWQWGRWQIVILGLIDGQRSDFLDYRWNVLLLGLYWWQILWLWWCRRRQVCRLRWCWWQVGGLGCSCGQLKWYLRWLVVVARMGVLLVVVIVMVIVAKQVRNISGHKRQAEQS